MAKEKAEAAPQVILPTAANMKPAEYERTLYYLSVHAATTPEQMLDPSYWAHVANKLRPNDELVVMTEDRALRVHLLVMDVEQNSARVAQLSATNLDPVSSLSIIPGFTVVWGTQDTKFRIFRESDKRIVHEGFPSRTAAYSWLAQNSHVIKAA